MARSRFLLILTIAVALAGVGAWYRLERAESVVKATASPVPVTVAIASSENLPILTGPRGRLRSFSIAVPGAREEELSC
jgi:hypothetical protein